VRDCKKSGEIELLKLLASGPTMSKDGVSPCPYRHVHDAGVGVALEGVCLRDSSSQQCMQVKCRSLWHDHSTTSGPFVVHGCKASTQAGSTCVMSTTKSSIVNPYCHGRPTVLA
jgi:hypothetical protein